MLQVQASSASSTAGDSLDASLPSAGLSGGALQACHDAQNRPPPSVIPAADRAAPGLALAVHERNLPRMPLPGSSPPVIGDSMAALFSHFVPSPRPKETPSKA